MQLVSVLSNNYNDSILITQIYKSWLVPKDCSELILPYIPMFQWISNKIF